MTQSYCTYRCATLLEGLEARVKVLMERSVWGLPLFRWHGPFIWVFFPFVWIYFSGLKPIFSYLVVNNSQLLSYQWNSCWKQLSEISVWLATTFGIYLLFKFQNTFFETHVLNVTQINQFLRKVKKTDLQKKKKKKKKKKEKNWIHTFNLSIVLRSFV